MIEFFIIIILTFSKYLNSPFFISLIIMQIKTEIYYIFIKVKLDINLFKVFTHINFKSTLLLFLIYIILFIDKIFMIILKKDEYLPIFL